MNSNDEHQHLWVEKSRVTQPNAHGVFILPLWDTHNTISRKVPSIYSECECGDSLISPITDASLPQMGEEQVKVSEHLNPVTLDLGQRTRATELEPHIVDYPGEAAFEIIWLRDRLAEARRLALEEAAQIAESFAEEIHMENADTGDIAAAIRNRMAQPGERNG